MNLDTVFCPLCNNNDYAKIKKLEDSFVCESCNNTFSHKDISNFYKNTKSPFTEQEINDNFEYQKAFEIFSVLAKFGHTESMRLLTYCYFYGDGVKEDLEKALFWYIQLAEGGCRIAQFNLAYCYFYGIDLPLDYKKAIYWNNKAVEQNYEIAIKFYNEQIKGMEDSLI